MSNISNDLFWAALILAVALLGWSGVIGQHLAQGGVVVAIAAYAAFGTRRCTFAKAR